MKAWIGAVALAGMLASGSAIAQDGNELLVQCQSTVRVLDGVNNDPDYHTGYCMGLVRGIMDVMFGLGENLPSRYRICPPSKSLQYGQGIRIVTKYLTDHPAKLNLDGSSLVAFALQDAYPCKG